MARPAAPPPHPVRLLVEQLGPRPASAVTAWLADRIGALIGEGRIPLGARLPSDRALAQAVGVTRGTAVRALALLEERELITSRQGSGRTVRLPRGTVAPVESLSARSTPAQAGTLDLRATVLPPHPQAEAAALEAVAGIGRDPSRGTAPAHGLPELLEAICAHYDRRGLPTSPDEVTVTTGAVAGLHLALRAVTRRGDRVAVESPCYPNTARVARGTRRRIIPLDAGAAAEGMAEVLASGSLDAAMLTPDFHNPTGRLRDARERGLLLEAARLSGTPLVVDETLVGMNWRGLTMPPPMVRPGTTTLLVGSASKSLWAGLRIGWIRAPRALTETIGHLRLGVDLGAAVLEQRITAALLPQGPDPQILAEVAAQHEALRAGLARHLPHWSAPAADGGLSLWCTGLRRPSPELVARAAARGLALTPGGLFSPTGRGGDDAIRLPFSAPADRIGRALEILGEIESDQA
ncbi:PLP-dependent aminotransferase family protein [Brachybacterium phenoliresistens]|uniref:GntR family transcriptional regulator n=1 Tax=Brachybacterium phenoliresistens TaxID=396014 RepID=Z9JUD6_9MICO|nr:PLP-dependent aminotransferase family protein [Brachybacterium phenoliresistens]EWS81618.1 GntR family transcriptional regulator [Brachybacterium phenoliresistens]